MLTSEDDLKGVVFELIKKYYGVCSYTKKIEDIDVFIYRNFQDFIVRIPGRGDMENYLALTLFFAALHEEDDIFKKYIKVSTEKDIALALTQLAIGGNKDAINTFIRNGANTTSQDPHGYTPLLAALKEIQRSENLNLYGYTNHDRKPYMCYKIRNVLNVCELLLEHGANLNDYKLSNYSSSVVDYSAIEIMACLFNLWTAGDYSYLDNRPGGTNESFKDKLVHLMSRNYYKLSNKGKDIIKEERNESLYNCLKDNEKDDKNFSSGFPTLYHVLSKCNERSEEVLITLANKDTQSKSWNEVRKYSELYEKNLSTLPSPAELAQHILDSARRVLNDAQEVSNSTRGIKVREIKERVESNHFIVASSKSEEEKLLNSKTAQEGKKVIIFRAENILCSILASIGNKSEENLTKIKHIACRQGYILKDVLKKEDLQNIAGASLVHDFSIE